MRMIDKKYRLCSIMQQLLMETELIHESPLFRIGPAPLRVSPAPSALLGRDPLLRRFISILLPFHAKVAAAAVV